MQIGPLAPAALATLRARHLLLLGSLASFHLYYKELQKSPFLHHPWDARCLRLKFVLRCCVPSPWEDFQSS
jgi:trafficking protein particle complex subunit 9